MRVRITETDHVSVNVRKKPRVLINQSGVILRKIGDLIDVDLTAKTDGSLLIYDAESEKFVASTLLEKQVIDGGEY